MVHPLLALKRMVNGFGTTTRRKETMIGSRRIVRYGLSAVVAIGLNGFGSLAGAQQSLAGGLVQQLKEMGWQTEQTDEGLMLMPPETQTRAPAANATTSGVAREGFKERLRRLGWRIEESPDGTLTFYPPGLEPRAPMPDAEKATKRGPSETPTETRPVIQDTKTSQLPVAALRAAGWHASQQPNGALLLRPRSGEAPKAVTVTERAKTLRPATIDAPNNSNMLDINSAGTFRLPAQSGPIRTPRHAAFIAQSWLRDTGMSGLQVGRVRKILRVYLISIVDASPPYWLQHQVAVRAQDGLLVPIY